MRITLRFLLIVFLIVFVGSLVFYASFFSVIESQKPAATQREPAAAAAPTVARQDSERLSARHPDESRDSHIINIQLTERAKFDTIMAGEQTIRRPDFNGKWVVYKNENFEEYMAANGANWIVRKMAANAKPTVEVTQAGDRFSIKLHSMFITREENFTVGEPYEQNQHDGSLSNYVKQEIAKHIPKNPIINGEIKALYQAMASWEGDSLVIRYEPIAEGAGPCQKITRHIENSELILTLEVNDVKARRWFQKVIID